MSSAKNLPPKFSLTVQYALRDETLPARSQVRRWTRAAAPAGESAVVTVRFVDSEEGRALNRNFRGQNHATNVLSFPYQPSPQIRGDIVVCVPVVLDEARTQEKKPAAHFAHLMVHGMLHLRGYDHETETEAKKMEALEIAILHRLGFPNPYERN